MLLSFNFVKQVSSIQTIVLAMAVGILIAALLSVYYRSLLGQFIRHLVKENAFSEEKALSLEQTPYGKNIFIRSALASGNAYGSVLYYTDGEKTESIRPHGKRPDKKQIEARKYFIPEELKYRAEFMFDKKGSNLPGLILSILAVAALVVFCLLVIPDLLTMVENFVNEFFK